MNQSTACIRDSLPVATATGRIIDVPADYAHITRALLNTLSEAGAEPYSLEGFGSHSLKNTFLSLIATYGVHKSGRHDLCRR